MNNILDYQKIITKKRGEVEAQIKRKNTIDEKLKELSIRSIAIEEAQAFIQQTAKATQEKLRYNIEPIMQLAVDAVFPNEYIFNIDFKISNNRTVAELKYLTKNGHERKPLLQNGGGLCDVTSLALRIALWSIGKTDNVIILDEPLKNLQPLELNRLGFEVIKTISKKLGIQFILVNNSLGSENLIDISDKVFEVTKREEEINGKKYKVSKVKEV